MPKSKHKPILGKIYRNVNTNNLLTVVHNKATNTFEVWRKLACPHSWKKIQWQCTKLSVDDTYHMLEKGYLTTKGLGKYKRARARIRYSTSPHRFDSLWIEIPKKASQRTIDTRPSQC